MAIFKIEKATTKEAHETKKLAKQVAAIELGSAKKGISLCPSFPTFRVVEGS
jgi:hypothetical protein